MTLPSRRQRPSLPRHISPAVFLLVVGLSSLGTGCEPEHAPREDAGPSSDVDTSDARTSKDTAPNTPDTTESQDADADTSKSPPARTATLSQGATRVSLSFEPFHLEIRDAQGDRLTGSRATDVRAFHGLAVAKADGYRSKFYYNPALTENDGRGDRLAWYVPGEVLASTVTEEAARFRVALEGPSDGERDDAPSEPPRPTVTVELKRTEVGIALRVRAPEEKAYVHTALSLEAADGEGFYGLGEQFDTLDNRGHLREMQIQANGDSESSTNEVHVPIPFYLSTRGYGFFAEDRHPGAVDVGKTQADVVRTTFNSRDITYHFFVRPTPLALVEAYTDLTGKPAHVPFWALAPHWWRNVNSGQAQVLEDAKRGREADIPSSVLWIDRPWSSYYHNWKFNNGQFPKPDQMLKTLEAQGYRVLLHHSPQMNVPGDSDLGAAEDASEMLYQMYEDNGWLVTFAHGPTFLFPWGGGTGGFVDFSHPEAVDHVQTLLQRVTKLGVVGTKMDWDEFLQPNVGTMKLELKFANGETNQTMKGWYSALYHKTIIEGFDEAAGEPTFHISRSGAPGDQVWNTCIWPGDLDNDFTEHTRGPSKMQQKWNVGGMPAAMMANQSLGMSGYPCFGSDIGGFRNGQPAEEVLIRWLAFGTFNAVMQLGGGGSTHMPWSADTPYSKKALEVARKYFRLRMRLFPYIFHYLRAAEQTGRPLVRSLYLQFPEDPASRDHERDFMFGPDLLVAPITTKGATERTLYLPPGEWIDFWTGERVTGGDTTTRAAPLETIPLYLRAGAIVPMAPESIDTLVPASDASVKSYQDERTTQVHLVPEAKGRRLSLFNGLTVETHALTDTWKVDLTIGAPSGEVDQRIAFAPQTVELRVEVDGTPFESGPGEVTLDGQPLPEGDTKDCTSCWSFDNERPMVKVRLAGGGSLQVK